MTWIFDAHVDLWSDVVVRRGLGEKNIFKRRHLEKFKAGEIGGGIFVMWIDPPHDQYPEIRLEEMLEAAREELLEAAPLLRLVRDFTDIEKARSESKLPFVFGAEGLSGIGTQLNRLEDLYELGLRHASLTWNEANPLATGVGGDPQRGLTPLGFEALERMASLGMLLDVSHLNEKSFWDVLKTVNQPVIASHSSARTLCDVSRNLTDAQLEAVAATGGVVGVNSYRAFLDPVPERQTLERFVDHVDFMAQRIGVDHVGLGFDFCDYLEVPVLSSQTEAPLPPRETQGLEDARKAGAVLELLARRGYDQASIEKIANGNFLRVLRQVLTP